MPAWTEQALGCLPSCCRPVQALYPLSTSSEGSYLDPAIVATIDALNSGQR